VTSTYRSLGLGCLLLTNVEMAIIAPVVEVSIHNLEAEMYGPMTPGGSETPHIETASPPAAVWGEEVHPPITFSEQEMANLAELSHLKELQHGREVHEHDHPDDGFEGPDADDPTGQTTELVIEAVEREAGEREVAEPEVAEPEVAEQPQQDERSLEIQRARDAMEQAIAARRAALESKEMEL
jgi:hypothetical protein